MLTPNVVPGLNPYATANYLSPLTTGAKCIEFYYYMYGPEVGELSLYRETIKNSIQTVGSRLWTRTKSSEPMWLFASANYSPQNSSESFRFNLAFVIGNYGYNVSLILLN